MGVMTIVGAVKPEWLQDTTISLILAVLPLYLVGMPVLIAVVKRMPGEAPAKKKHYTGTVCSGTDHVFCTDVLW